MYMNEHKRIISNLVVVGLLIVGLFTRLGSSLMVVHAEPGITTRVSVASDGSQGDYYSYLPSISADGRYVAFVSRANNLVDGDTNGFIDVFVHDRQTGQTTRVSVASGGEQGDRGSSNPSISADGRYLAFESEARNLVDNDTNGRSDVFVHDRQTGQTTRVSISTGGDQANDASMDPSISADGRYVSFLSRANNLVDNDTNGMLDIFVHDRQTGQTTRVSVASSGEEGDLGAGARPSISADGRYVAFASSARNLVDNDTNDMLDIFVHDQQTGQTTRVSVASDGEQGNDNSYAPSVSADGRYVAFASYADNLVTGDTNDRVDIFVRDRQTGQTTRVSVASNGEQGDRSSSYPSISADGRYVVFYSEARNLVAGDTNFRLDVFVHDRQTGETTRVSIASNGDQGNDDVDYFSSISADGRYAAFASKANNLVSGDTNGVRDVFVHDRGGGELSWRIYLPLVLRE
jgi:Tol biopolymer transport system component